MISIPASDLEGSYVGEVSEVEQCGDTDGSADLVCSVSDERAVLETGKVTQPSLRVNTRTYGSEFTNSLISCAATNMLEKHLCTIRLAHY